MVAILDYQIPGDSGPVFDIFLLSLILLNARACLGES